MKEIPILMTNELVVLALRDAKTQTRRFPKRQPEKHWRQVCPGSFEFYTGADLSDEVAVPARVEHRYGKPGDVLWVKENHWRFGKWVKTGKFTEGKVVRGLYRKPRPRWRFVPHKSGHGVVYRDDLPPPRDSRATRRTQLAWHHRPSLFMPRWACRLELEVLDTKLEPLQDISEADAKAEGIQRFTYKESCGEKFMWGLKLEQPEHGATAKIGFEILWEKVNGAASWKENPWVVAVRFRRKQ